MRSRTLALGSVLVCLATLLVQPGCGKKAEKEPEEIKTLPDSLVSFREKIDWLIPRSFESLEYACQNKADQEIDAAISLHAFVPAEKFLGIFEGVAVQFKRLYYGYEVFSSVFTVDPTLPIDSTIALLQLEARSRLAEQIRYAEEQIGNVTDDLQRQNVERELGGLKAGLAEIEANGVMLYGAEVRAYPEDLKGLMFRPEGLIRVIFPGVPTDGSWVRISPFHFDRMMQADQAAADARAAAGAPGAP